MYYSARKQIRKGDHFKRKVKSTLEEENRDKDSPPKVI